MKPMESHRLYGVMHQIKRLIELNYAKLHKEVKSYSDG